VDDLGLVWLEAPNGSYVSTGLPIHEFPQGFFNKQE
jgi:hypothetical protein